MRQHKQFTIHLDLEIKNWETKNWVTDDLETKYLETRDSEILKE